MDLARLRRGDVVRLPKSALLTRMRWRYWVDALQMTKKVANVAIVRPLDAAVMAFLQLPSGPGTAR